MKFSVERYTLSIPEAAEVLGIHHRTAYKLAKAGELPVLRLGGRTLVKRDELLRMVGAEHPTEAARD